MGVLLGALVSMAKSNEAQKKYDGGLYREAAELFEKDFESNRSEESFVKGLQSRMMLKEYENTLKKALKAPNFKEKKWDIFHRIVYLKSIEKFISHYSHQMARTEIKGDVEPIKRTPAYWQAELKKSVAKLLQDDAFLLSIKLESVKSFFYFKDIDIEALPTVYDWLVNEVISNYYWGMDSSKAKLAAVEKAIVGKETDRRYIRDYWRMMHSKLTFPSIPSHFYFDPNGSDIANLPTQHQDIVAEIAKVANKLETPRGRAEWFLFEAKYFGRIDTKKTLAKCRDAVAAHQGVSTSECLNIIRQIERKEISLGKNRFHSKSELVLPATTRNLKDVWLRVYATDTADIEKNFEQIKSNQYGRDFTAAGLKKIISEKPLLMKKFSLDPKNLNLNHKVEFNLGKLEPGLYRVVASDSEKIEDGKTFVHGMEIRISDIQLVYQLAGQYDPEKSLGEKEIKRIPSHYFYVFDNESGKLMFDVPLKASIQKEDSTRKTDKNGSVVFNDGWDFRGRAHSANESSSVMGVAQIKNSVSSYRNDYVYKPSFQHLKYVVEFDRPIYRPGQKINIKATLLRRVPFGFRVLPNAKISIKIMNPQYQAVAETNLHSNSQGSVAWAYDLPMTGMLGQYQIQFSASAPEISDRDYTKNFSDSFQVEEYKRPDYFVDVEKSKSPWVFDKEVKIKVSAKYYYGAPVKKGRMTYKISSHVFYPWFWRHYETLSPSREDAGIETSGEGVLDDKGEFTLTYIPKANGNDSRRFVVRAYVWDESGRSIDGSSVYTASKQEFFINALAVKEFFKKNEKPILKVNLEDLNGAFFEGQLNYEVWELIPPTVEEKKKIKAELNLSNPYYGHRDSSVFDFRKGFEKLLAKSIAKGIWTIGKNKSEFVLGSLPEGVFKIKMQTKDSYGQKIESETYLIVAETGRKLSQFYIPEMTLLSKSEFKIGETASILFGSSEFSGDVVGFLIKNQLQLENPVFKDNQGIKIYDFKVTESMFNGVSFTWFSVHDNEVIQDRKMITVDNEYKKMDIRFDKTSLIKPGQNSQLKIVNKSKAADLEAMISMYDQSLEFYATRERNHFKEIYQNSDASQDSEFQFEYLESIGLLWVHPDLKSMLEKFRKNKNMKYRPLLLIDADRLRQENDYTLGLESQLNEGAAEEEIATRGAGGFAGAPAAALSKSMIASADSAEIMSRKPSKKNASSAVANDVTAESKPIEVRKNFSETAVFEPFFKLNQDSTKLNFKAPDQLTAWKTKLLAISSQGLIGADEQIILSQKDFFVRVLASRYLREGDVTEIKLKVDNSTEQKMSASLSLEISGDGINAADLFKGQGPDPVLKKTVDIPANDSYTQTWKIKVPSVLGVVKIKGIVTAGNETDAEEKTLSILPSRQRLIENTLVYLKEKQNILKLKNWNKKDATRQNELMSLQIDPQLPILLLNSVPSLVNYPYSCSEQLINKYVPLAIINSLYQNDPQLKNAVTQALAKTGNRKTVTLPWEEKDPRRLMELTETPWIANSKGMTSPYELISYMNADTIAKLKDEIFRDLKSRQLLSGGFSWFSGGREDLYITLIILEGLSEAAMYGVEFPKDLFEKALHYVYGELPKYLKAQIGELQFLIFGMYVFTSFDSKLNKLSHNKEVAQVWVPFIEKHDTLLTPLGHAYMAHIFKRLGNEKKSQASLKRALDGGQKDDLIGYHWTPEERSWLWYSDSVEKHAFFLQTLIQLKPKDDRIDSMAQWLLFNRKGNEWKSTKATSKAIFSLIHYLRLRTRFKEKTQLAIEWGTRKENFKLDPLDIDQKEPLRFVKTENIKSNDGEVKITKTGTLPVFAGLTWIYSSDEMTDASGSSVLDLKREFYLVRPDKLTPLKTGSKVVVGDEIEVVLTVKSKSLLEYIHLKDPRGAGFESNSLLSGYQWDGIGRYEEPRDSLMNFFFDRMPKGEYMVRHRFKATTAGQYKINSATIQSMYAPEMTAYSSSFRLDVVEK